MTTWSDTFSTRSGVSYSVEVYQQSQNYAANQSTLRIIVKAYETSPQTSWSSVAANHTWDTTVAGQTYSDNWTFDFRPSGLQSYTLLNTTKTVTHDADGYYTASITGSSATSTVLGTASFGTRSLVLSRIPKVPDAPTPTGIDQISPTSMRYNFTAGSNNGASITRHDVERSLSDGPFSAVETISGLGTSVTFSSLSNHTTYFFRSRSVNSQGVGDWSTTLSSATLGHPTAPLALVVTPSATTTGVLALSWDEPATPGDGGIVGYNIFRDGVQIATTTGTGRTYTDTGRIAYTSYSYTIAARNAYSTSVSGLGPQSAATVVVAPGPPGPPTALSGISDVGVAGKIDFTWTAPAVVGAGGITGYNLRFSTNALAASVTGTGTSVSVTGLTPGQTYSFYVTARNALADIEASESVASNTVTVTALGEPPATTGLAVVASTSVAGRLTLAWTPASGSPTGYSIFDRVLGVDTLVAVVKTSSYVIDNLTSGVSRTYVVRTRSAYTDSLGTTGGPASTPVSGVPLEGYSIGVGALSGLVMDTTNSGFNGTYTINAITPTTLRYAKTAANVTSVVSGGSVVDNTNASFNGTYTITTPTPTTISYPKVAASVVAGPVTGSSLTDTTNASFNGTHAVTAVNVGASTVSYSRIGSAVSSRVVPVNTPPGGRGQISNTTNAVYNGTDLEIVALTETTLSYDRVNADIAETNAAGIVADATNRDQYNGVWTVSSVPSYNTFEYVTGGDDQDEVSTGGAGSVDAQRTTSPGTLNILYRSGWVG